MIRQSLTDFLKMAFTMSALSPAIIFTATYIGAHLIWSACHGALLNLHKLEAKRLRERAQTNESNAHHQSQHGLLDGLLTALKPFFEDEFTRRRTGNYVLSILHSSTTSLISLVWCFRFGFIRHGSDVAFYDSAQLVEGGGVPGTAPLEASRRLLAFSVAYFLHDLVSTLPDWHRNPLDILHHITGVVLTSSPLLCDAASAMGQHILVTELSTPPLNAMWFLRKAGWEGSPPYKAAAYVFVLLFFTTRLLYLPALTFSAVRHCGAAIMTSAPQVLLLMFVLNIVNFYWWHRILLMLRKGKAEHPTHMSDAEYEAAASAAAAAGNKSAVNAGARAPTAASTDSSDSERKRQAGAAGSGSGRGAAALTGTAATTVRARDMKSSASSTVSDGLVPGTDEVHTANALEAEDDVEEEEEEEGTDEAPDGSPGTEGPATTPRSLADAAAEYSSKSKAGRRNGRQFPSPSPPSSARSSRGDGPVSAPVSAKSAASSSSSVRVKGGASGGGDAGTDGDVHSNASSALRLRRG